MSEYQQQTHKEEVLVQIYPVVGGQLAEGVVALEHDRGEIEGAGAVEVDKGESADSVGQ